MKLLMMAVALVAGPALACPADDGSKDADATRSTGKAEVASTAKPAAPVRVAKQKTAPAAKVAVKSAAVASKAPPL